MKFINIIIGYLIVNVLNFQETSQKSLPASLNKTDKKFILKLYKNSNIIVSKTQIHFFLHNITCFKYRAAIIKKMSI